MRRRGEECAEILSAIRTKSGFINHQIRGGTADCNDRCVVIDIDNNRSRRDVSVNIRYGVVQRKYLIIFIIAGRMLDRRKLGYGISASRSVERNPQNNRCALLNIHAGAVRNIAEASRCA